MMTKENGVKQLTDMVADFVGHIGKKLPDDVVKKLEELGNQETAALPKVLYETMTKNQKLAVELDRPSCQDTGVIQFWLKCGTNFPYINELEVLLKEAVVQATFATPLRHNSVAVSYTHLHLHWDHSYNLEHFPNARILVQRKELHYAVAPQKHERRPYSMLPGTQGPHWWSGLLQMEAVDGD